MGYDIINKPSDFKLQFYIGKITDKTRLPMLRLRMLGF